MALGPLETIGPAFSFASNVIEQFKPARSPYLLTAALGTLFISFALDNEEIEIGKKLLILVPIYVIISVIAILTFRFKPFEEKDVTPERMVELEIDIDTQFKLARIAGLVTGIACLYLVTVRRDEIDIYYILSYLMILIHCVVYLIYTMFRNIKEESFNNKSYFQLSFMTSLFLFLFTFSSARLPPSSRGFWWDQCGMHLVYTAQSEGPQLDATIVLSRCLSNEIPRKLGINDISSFNIITLEITERRISAYLVTSIVMLSLWVVYIIFWTAKIVSIWRRSSFVVSD